MPILKSVYLYLIYIYTKFYLYCITPLAWVEIQFFALTIYMPTCSRVDKSACLHACTLIFKLKQPYPTPPATPPLLPSTSVTRRKTNWAPTCLPKSSKIHEKSMPRVIPILASFFDRFLILFCATIPSMKPHFFIQIILVL